MASVQLITVRAYEACSPVPGHVLPEHRLMGKAFTVHVQCECTLLKKSVI